MNPVQEALTSKRTLKKFLIECDFTFLIQLQESISVALDERKTEHEAQEKMRKEREARRLEILELIRAEGFSPSELVSEKHESRAAKRKVKYQYTENGLTRYWSGVGRTPVPIQQELDAGKNLESFLIQETGN